MITMDMRRAQILRQRIDRMLEGRSIQDGVGALERVIVDVLTSLPGMDEAGTVSAFEAMACDVCNLIRERFESPVARH